MISAFLRTERRAQRLWSTYERQVVVTRTELSVLLQRRYYQYGVVLVHWVVSTQRYIGYELQRDNLYTQRVHLGGRHLPLRRVDIHTSCRWNFLPNQLQWRAGLGYMVRRISRTGATVRLHTGASIPIYRWRQMRQGQFFFLGGWTKSLILNFSIQK